MKYKKVTAIFPALELDKVEKELIGIGVPGMKVSRAHGFGEYRNYYAKDTMSDCACVEIYIDADKADEIVRTIARTVHQGLTTDGIIAVLPVDDLLHIRDFEES